MLREKECIVVGGEPKGVRENFNAEVTLNPMKRGGHFHHNLQKKVLPFFNSKVRWASENRGPASLEKIWALHCAK